MSDTEYIQAIVEHTAKLATKAAMDGHPARVMWLPPQSGTDGMYGKFIVIDYPPLTGSMSEPWLTKGI